MLSSFQAIDWQEALDVESRIAAVPTTALVRGMFFHDLNVLLPKDERSAEYSALRSYGAQDYMRLLVQVSERVYPEKSLRDGLRCIGATVMRSFLASTLGKLLDYLCKDIQSALRKSAAAMEAVQNYGSVKVIEQGERSTHMSLKGVWDFADCHYIGLYEEIIRHRGETPSVTLIRHTPVDVDLLIEW